MFFCAIQTGENQGEASEFAIKVQSSIICHEIKMRGGIGGPLSIYELGLARREGGHFPSDESARCCWEESCGLHRTVKRPRGQEESEVPLRNPTFVPVKSQRRAKLHKGMPNMPYQASAKR